MTFRAWVTCFLLFGVGLCAVFNAYAKEPVFVRWLVVDDPGDQTIRDYWERYDREELSAAEMVDLGTMLFYRGYPKDAVRVLEAALDLDKKLDEAWFRIGLVEHQQGNHRQARMAYKNCLKLFKGHGWCNFYLALLEEQDGNAKTAMEYYRRAFRYAPVLADPLINPEVASSDLSLGAWLRMARENSFKKDFPMPFLDPEQVEKVRDSYDDEAEAAPVGKPGAAKTAAKPKKEGAEKKDAEKEEAEKQSAVKAPAAEGGGSASAVQSGEESGEPKGGTKKYSPRTRGRARPVEQPAETPTPAPSDRPAYGLPGTASVSSDTGF